MGAFDWLFNRNKTKYGADDKLVEDVYRATAGGTPVGFQESMQTLFPRNAWTQAPEFSPTGQGAIQYSPKPQPDISDYRPPVTSSFGKFASDWFKKGYSSKKHQRSATINFGEGEVYNKYGNYSKTEAARVLGISKKELERRAKAGGFNSTQDYFESLQGGQVAGARDYVGEFMSALVPDVHAQGFGEGSVTPYRSGAVQTDEGGQTVGGAATGFMGNLLSRLGFNNIGNWGLPEFGLTEAFGRGTGLYEPRFGSIGTAYGAGTQAAAEQLFTPGNIAGQARANLGAIGSFAPTPSPEGVAPTADWGGYTSAAGNIGVGGNVPSTQVPVPTGTGGGGEVAGTTTTAPMTPVPTDILGNPFTTNYAGLSETTQGAIGTYGSDIGQAVQDLEDQYVAGAKDETELIQEVADLKKEQLESTYDALLAKYPTMEAKLRGEADIALQEIADLLDTAYGTGEAQRGRAKRTYGDIIRGRVKQSKLDEKRLRNIFTSLGTAESSAFMENLMALTHDVGSDIAGIKESQAFELGEIDRYIRDSESWASRETAKINLNKMTGIQQIQNDQSLTEAQKVQAIQELNLAALTEIADIQNQTAILKAQLPLQMAQLEASLRGTYGGLGDYNPFLQQVQAMGTPPMYTPVAGEGAISDDGKWIYQAGQWRPL